MQTPQEIIRALESDNSRLAKEAIISQALKESNTVFFDGVRLALDNLITFGVKVVPTHSGVNGKGLSFNEFTQLVTQLANREITGHAARDAIQAAMETATEDEWNNWYRRILIKDLRAGVSDKTINKVCKNHKKYQVPVFSAQLAHDAANHPNKVNGKKLVSVKLDGVRLLSVVYPNGHVVQFSRNGKEMHNFVHIKDQLSAVASSFTEPTVLDGEVMSSSFQDLMKQAHRKENANTSDAVLHLFDIIPLSKFSLGVHDVPQIERSEQLNDWYETVRDKLLNVRVLSQIELNLSSFADNVTFMQYNEKAIADGYEGLMLKDLDAPYECKRTHAWLKIKPVITVDLEIVGVEEGTGKNVGKLGALICEGKDNDKFIRVNVGSGLTDEQRDTIWKDKENTIGQIVEIAADCVTKSQDSDDEYSLRFPRFVRFRGFKTGEKI